MRGKVVSGETRAKIGAARKDKLTTEAKAKMGAAHHKKVMTQKGLFNSVGEAAIGYSVSTNTLRRYIKNKPTDFFYFISVAEDKPNSPN